MSRINELKLLFDEALSSTKFSLRRQQKVGQAYSGFQSDTERQLAHGEVRFRNFRDPGYDMEIEQFIIRLASVVVDHGLVQQAARQSSTFRLYWNKVSRGPPSRPPSFLFPLRLGCLLFLDFCWFALLAQLKGSLEYREVAEAISVLVVVSSIIL